MTRFLLPFTFLFLVAGCSPHVVAPKPMTSTFHEGVVFLDDERVQSSFCYAYGADEGKLSARKKVKEIALREAIEASSVKIMSMFESSTECTTSETACEKKQKSYFITSVKTDTKQYLCTEFCLTLFWLLRYFTICCTLNLNLR